MNCSKCDYPAVINLQHGALCKLHFINYFEEKIFKTIKRNQLIERKDRLCAAVSGGKDSLTMLYLVKKYLQINQINAPLTALAVDEGISGYREHTLEDLKEFCKKEEVDLKIISSKEEFGFTLDQAYPLLNQKTGKKPCNICGVWRRYLINKYARRLGATKLITGHNLDDEAQAIVMNIFKANTKLAAHLGLISGIQDHPLFVRRVKPLYFCAEKETRLYVLLKEFKVRFNECPYASEGYRIQIRDMLNDFENKYKGTKQGIINYFLDILPLLKAARDEHEEIKVCELCQEPANGKVCKACEISAEIKRNKNDN